jgi:hypothetical protein
VAIRVRQPRLCGSTVAVEEGRGGDVRYLGEIDTTEARRASAPSNLRPKLGRLCGEPATPDGLRGKMLPEKETLRLFREQAHGGSIV